MLGWRSFIFLACLLISAKLPCFFPELSTLKKQDLKLGFYVIFIFCYYRQSRLYSRTYKLQNGMFNMTLKLCLNTGLWQYLTLSTYCKWFQNFYFKAIYSLFRDCVFSFTAISSCFHGCVFFKVACSWWHCCVFFQGHLFLVS